MKNLQFILQVKSQFPKIQRVISKLKEKINNPVKNKLTYKWSTISPIMKYQFKWQWDIFHLWDYKKMKIFILIHDEYMGK